MIEESQKLVLITGSATRIGKYLARRFADKGWRIALHYHHSEDSAYELAKELLPKVDVMLFKADLSDVNQTIAMAEEVKRLMGSITLLINNASVYKNDNLANLDVDNLEQSLNIHLSSPLHLAKAMLGTSGNVINIIDTDITHNMHKFFSYSLAKKAMLNLTKMLAFSMAPDVRVNAIAPGPILFKEGQDIELFNRLIHESPLKIKPELEDLYQTVEFLVNTSCITGQCVFLDGGRHLQ